MAYVPEQVIAQFRFESGFYKTFKPLMEQYNARRPKSEDESIESAHDVSGGKRSADRTQRQEGVSVEEVETDEQVDAVKQMLLMSVKKN